MMALQRWLVVSLSCFQAAALSIPLPCNNTNVELEQLNASTNALEALSVLQKATMRNLRLEEHRHVSNNASCSLDNAAVRQDW
jgi:hypothetical protein